MASEDQEMTDVATNGEGDITKDVDEEPFVQRIRILPGDSKSAASYEFSHEDHTLGNALRHMIMKNPDVEFCGYSIPHPSDPKMHLRIQTYDDVAAIDVLEKGLDDLIKVCDVVIDKFDAARTEFGKTPAPSS